MPIKLTDIKSIHKNPEGKGYLIELTSGRSIKMDKRRTIPALLTLIRFGEGCENDLTKLTNNLQELKQILKGKIPEKLIQDSYSDANKPFSELWNEEGFTFIQNPPGETRQGSQKYVLLEEDHEKLFTAAKKACRSAPSDEEQKHLLEQQEGRCNLCGSVVKPGKDVLSNTFARDRVRLVWDHRIPVEKGGDSEEGNYQGLCFYCNKCKWQICNICDSEEVACEECALAFPEKTMKIYPTGEDISDRAPLLAQTDD
jgi:hypothetical protein